MNKKRNLIISKIEKAKKLEPNNIELQQELDLFKLELLSEFKLIKHGDLTNMEHYFNGTDLIEFSGDYTLFKNNITMFVKNNKTGKILKNFIRGWCKKETVKLRPKGDTKFKSYTLVELAGV